MEREHCIYKAREHSSRSGERTLYPVAIIKNIGVTKEQKKLKEVMDEQYIAFLLLESMYKSGKINKATYENVLKEKRKYIEEKYNIKDVIV